MRRDQLEHVLRAASRIGAEPDLVVIGSQAILGTYDEDQLPEEAVASIEADICFLDDPDEEKADRVDGAIGELSPFHSSFGIYAQGVSIRTATLPRDWADRLVVLDTPATEPGRGLCLEPHDLVASKLVAGREKDFRFTEALLREGLVDVTTLLTRIDEVAIDEAAKEHLRTWVRATATQGTAT